MKKYTLSFSAAITHTPEHPERTARRAASTGFDYIYQVWPNRESMAQSIRMQEKRAFKQTDWNAIIKLSSGEGY